MSSAASIAVTVVAPPLQAVAPLANGLALTLFSGQTFSSVLSASGHERQPMHGLYAITTKPKHGSRVPRRRPPASSAIRRRAGYTGADSFDYTATDTVSKLASSAAAVTLTIAPAPPTAVHHGGPGRGGYGPAYLLLLLALLGWKRRVATWMRSRSLMLAMGSLALLWAVSVDAADPAPLPGDDWYAGGQINIIRPDAKRDAATHGPRGWGLLIGRDIGDYSLEFDGAYHSDVPRTLNDLANWKTYGVDGLWFFEHRESRLFTPFADAGLGLADEYYGDNTKLRKAYLALGIGFNSKPWQSLPVTLRTDLQLQHVLASYNDLVLSFGVVFNFGGPEPQRDFGPTKDDSSPQDYPMAWCTQEGGQPQETDSGWVCYLPDGKTESRPETAAPPAASVASPSQTTAIPPPVARMNRPVGLDQ